MIITLKLKVPYKVFDVILYLDWVRSDETNVYHNNLVISINTHSDVILGALKDSYTAEEQTAADIKITCRSFMTNTDLWTIYCPRWEEGTLTRYLNSITSLVNHSRYNSVQALLSTYDIETFRALTNNLPDLSWTNKTLIDNQDIGLQTIFTTNDANTQYENKKGFWNFICCKWD